MSSLTLVVTVGSDHHPFDRIVGWVDAWLDLHVDAPVDCVFQHGTAATPRHGRTERYVAHDEMQALLRSADVVVTQGGPMGIIEARRAGTKPIAVPRLGRLGEVVDDHQVTFCRHLAKIGDLILAEDPAALHAALDTVLGDPGAYAIDPTTVDKGVEAAVARFAALVDGLPERRGLLGLIGRR